MRIDAHHHLWDLNAVHYPWLMEQGAARFFGDPAPIQRDFLLDEFRGLSSPHGFTASVHIQVGAENGHAEAAWVQAVAEANPDWPMAQVVFCDLTAEDLGDHLDRFQALSTVRGVRQIIGRAPGEDAQTGTNRLLDDPRFLRGLRMAGERGLSFDLQLLPELMQKTTAVVAQAPGTAVALCHAGSPHDRSVAGLQSWSDKLIRLSDLENVTCKLSGLGMFDHAWTAKTIASIVSTCLTRFGADRCMFGSNFPVDSLSSDYATLIAAYEALVPEVDKAQVFGATASRFYDLA